MPLNLNSKMVCWSGLPTAVVLGLNKPIGTPHKLGVYISAKSSSRATSARRGPGLTDDVDM